MCTILYKKVYQPLHFLTEPIIYLHLVVMKKLILLVLFIPIISFGQEYEIKANATVAFSKACLDKAFKAVNGETELLLIG